MLSVRFGSAFFKRLNSTKVAKQTVLCGFLVLCLRVFQPQLVEFKKIPTDFFVTIISSLSYVKNLPSEFLNIVSGNYKSSSEQLLKENISLKEELHNMEVIKYENEELKKLLKINPGIGFEVVGANTISKMVSEYSRVFMINSGTDSGLQTNLLVVSDGGLVGRIIEVGNKWSKVLFITDINSRIPIAFETTREQAIVSGTNSPELKVLLANGKIATNVGETVVTSGEDGLFPAGVPVGKVSRITQTEVFVTPFIKEKRINYVAILKPKK